MSCEMLPKVRTVVVMAAIELLSKYADLALQSLNHGLSENELVPLDGPS